MGNWPDNADGDVFRSLEREGCDFSKPYRIDFFVDFPEWPPSKDVVALLKAKFGDVTLQDDDAEETPCVLCKMTGPLTYEFVTETQAKISAAVEPFDGCCMDWGVLV